MCLCTLVYWDGRRMDMISKYAVRREFGFSKKCAKCTFMYKVVEEKKRSAEHWHIVGSKVYGGRIMWSLNKDVQICMVRYEETKIRRSTER